MSREGGERSRWGGERSRWGGEKEEANGGGEKMQGEQNLGDQATMERGNPSLSGRTAPSSVASSFPNHKASASDIVALLGTRQQASQISAKEARQLRSCFKFLVPFTPNSIGSASGDWSICRRLWSKEGDGQCRREENELVWWPPEPVMELARLAVDSGGDPAAIHRTLDPTMIPVPDVEGCEEFRCELTRTPYGRRFINEELNSYLKFLFELIAARGPDVGLNVSLSRYDFFHGHLFLARETGRLGILFHAKRSPATGLKLDLEGDLPIVQSFFRVFQGDSDKIQIHTDGALARFIYLFFKLFCIFWKI